MGHGLTLPGRLPTEPVHVLTFQQPSDTSLVPDLPPPVLTAIFQVNLGYPVFIETKDDGGGGDNWSYKSCKAPVKSSPPTKRHPVFYRPDALPVAQPTVSKH